MKRPGFWLWLRYAFGGGLPADYREWVLHDTTAPTWLLRHLARVLVVVAVPTAVAFFAVPASNGVRALVCFTACGCAILLLAILSNDVTERRANKAGYPWGTAEATRAQRSTDAQITANARRRERAAARRHA